MSNLHNKVIALAGCGAIGGALARQYARCGAAVFIGDIDEADAAATARAITESGGRAAALRLDGSDDGEVADFFATAAKTFGGIDGVHLNFADFSGAHPDNDLLTLPIEVRDRQAAVNERGFVMCARTSLPYLIERGGGAMVFTTSGAAISPYAGGYAYGMAKAGVHALMRHIAYRYGPQLIRSNAVAPGYVPHQRLIETAAPGIAERAMQRNAYKGRPVHENDIAALCALLMSDDGATISGQILSVDGGATMRG